MLKLCPTYTNIFIEKSCCKKSLIGLNGLSSIKIIFALLTKVVIIYIQLIIIHLRHFSLKRLLALRRKLSKSLVQL